MDERRGKGQLVFQPEGTLYTKALRPEESWCLKALKGSLCGGRTEARTSRENAAGGRGRARPKILRVACITLSNQHTPSSPPHLHTLSLRSPLLSLSSFYFSYIILRAVSRTLQAHRTFGPLHLLCPLPRMLFPLMSTWLDFITSFSVTPVSPQWHQIKFNPPNTHTKIHTLPTIAPSPALFFFRAHQIIWYTKYLTYLFCLEVQLLKDRDFVHFTHSYICGPWRWAWHTVGNQ